MSSPKESNYSYAFPVVTALFFAWGFITALNDVLIPHLRNVFELSVFQSTLVQFAFFGAYFIGSLIYFAISATRGDPIARIGYKKGLILGLIIAACGCLLFIPAASFKIYIFFLFALFTLGLGLTLLQIAANPYVALLGKPETASARLNLSQAFNSFGTTISPVIGGYLIFEFFNTSTNAADSVKIPYAALASAFLLLAIGIAFVELPSLGKKDQENSGSALRYKNLVWGIGAIFCYVGAEVAIGSLLINFTTLPEILNVEEVEASKLLALYWGGAMVGRFVGSIAMSNWSSKFYRLLSMFVVSIVLFLLITTIAGLSLIDSLPFLIFIALNIVIVLLCRGAPSATLSAFAFIASVLLLIGVLSSGTTAFWAITAIGLFNSIMWPNIFTLSIAGLGDDTSQGSSLLVMAILGGALVPPMQGLVADIFGLQASFLFPIICYAYIMFFGLVGYKPIKR
ncbi:sugar MFS transporter [Agarilytica rhodophyticola]|uniref:sugar MFS transporter n=1 Tax=Agarilytica rhodophyticola TaxID=1737490 RepID=UPI000B3458C5|nr:sugar MFS transporter [Agarilytica rhodophyticola]